MLFIRIIEKGLDRNGNLKYKIVGYKPTDHEPRQYNYWSVQMMEKLDFGRINRASHSITTTMYKFQILEALDDKIGAGKYCYVFE
jgi:hypothetical protein